MPPTDMEPDPRELDGWLIAAETALARRDPSWPGGIDALLDDGFREVGASGRSWDRVSVETILHDPPTSDLVVDEFWVDHVASTVALVTYRTVWSGRASRRLSVWVSTPNGWRLRYHQGTVIPGA
jgi:hypothetical protein